jgi:hypothetical protein
MPEPKPTSHNSNSPTPSASTESKWCTGKMAETDPASATANRSPTQQASHSTSSTMTAQAAHPDTQPPQPPVALATTDHQRRNSDSESETPQRFPSPARHPRYPGGSKSEKANPPRLEPHAKRNREIELRLFGRQGRGSSADRLRTPIERRLRSGSRRDHSERLRKTLRSPGDHEEDQDPSCGQKRSAGGLAGTLPLRELLRVDSAQFHWLAAVS